MKTTLTRSVRFLKVVVAMLCSTSLWAQEVESTPLAGPYDFLAIKDLQLKTVQVIEYDLKKTWEGDSLHAGLLEIDFVLHNCKDIPKNLEMPEKPLTIIEVKDMDGNIIVRKEKDLTYTFNRLKFSKSFSEAITLTVAVPYGGVYNMSVIISPALYSYEEELLLADEPGIRIFGMTTTVKTPLCPEIVFTSGYPYNPADFSDVKTLNWKIAAAKSPSEPIAEDDEIIEFISKSPTLAAVDSLYLQVNDLVPGEYIYTLTSDFAPANYSFTAKIHDVLVPEISLDKEKYVVGESQEAVVKLIMNYGYPYVGVTEYSSTPTVKVTAELLGEKTSVSYSDEAWADSDMHCTAELKLPLDKVTEEIAKENKGEVPLHLTVMFNDVTQCETTIAIPFAGDYSGIGHITVDDSTNTRVKYYNVHGVEVDDTYKGIIITSNGQKLINAVR